MNSEAQTVGIYVMDMFKPEPISQNGQVVRQEPSIPTSCEALTIGSNPISENTFESARAMEATYCSIGHSMSAHRIEYLSVHWREVRLLW